MVYIARLGSKGSKKIDVRETHVLAARLVARLASQAQLAQLTPRSPPSPLPRPCSIPNNPYQPFFYVESFPTFRSRVLSCPVLSWLNLSLLTALECRSTQTATPADVHYAANVAKVRFALMSREAIQHMTFHNLLSIRVAFSLCYDHPPSVLHPRLMRAIVSLSVNGVSPINA